MNKLLTYIGGYPKIAVGGYVLNRDEPLEVPAELADAIDAAQTDSDPSTQTEPLFFIEDLV